MNLDLRRQKGRRIAVCGATGMVGSAIMRLLTDADPLNKNIFGLTRTDVDFRDESATAAIFRKLKADIVYICAARVGGIVANSTFPFEFVTENTQVQNSIFSAIRETGCDTALFLGSSCIYPKLARQPISERELLNGPLEVTNEAYAVAKICGLIQAKYLRSQCGIDVRSVMPTNLYGPGDNFDLDSSHVIPGLLRKFYSAVQNNADIVEIWGSGLPRREFLHVEDFARAAISMVDLAENDFWGSMPDNIFHVNVGSGSDLSIGELARLIQEVSGFQGRLVFDRTKPDGTPQKLLDISTLRNFGWSPLIELREGLEQTYEYMKQSI